MVEIHQSQIPVQTESVALHEGHPTHPLQEPKSVTLVPSPRLSKMYLLHSLSTNLIQKFQVSSDLLPAYRYLLTCNRLLTATGLHPYLNYSQIVSCIVYQSFIPAIV